VQPRVFPRRIHLRGHGIRGTAETCVASIDGHRDDPSTELPMGARGGVGRRTGAGVPRPWLRFGGDHL
jgi:hypothetical protein